MGAVETVRFRGRSGIASPFLGSVVSSASFDIPDDHVLFDDGDQLVGSNGFWK